MSNQPEALRLADQLENDYYDGVRIPDAAAELRRLHAEVESLRALLAEWEQKATTWLLSPEAATRLDGYVELGAMVAKAEAERDEARAELARLTTLRPASEHDRESWAIWHDKDDGAWVPICLSYSNTLLDCECWTPIPKVKEPK